MTGARLYTIQSEVIVLASEKHLGGNQFTDKRIEFGFSTRSIVKGVSGKTPKAIYGISPC